MDDHIIVENRGHYVLLTYLAPAQDLSWDRIEKFCNMGILTIEEMDPPCVILNLENLPICGSVIVATFLRFDKKVENRNGKLVLCNCSTLTTRLLDLMLKDKWELYDTLAEAAAAFQPTPA